MYQFANVIKTQDFITREMNFIYRHQTYAWKYSQFMY